MCIRDRDYVEGMWKMMQYKNPDDWVLATGETHTVKEFAKKAFDHVGLNYEDYVKVSEKYFRPNEVEYLLGDYSKAKKEIGWEPQTSFDDLVSMMVDHDIDEAKREKVLIENNLLEPTESKIKPTPLLSVSLRIFLSRFLS